MKNQTSKFLSLLLLCSVGVFNACQKDITIQIPTSDPKIVVNGLVYPDSNITVQVSRSLSVNDNSDYSVIKDATVSLLENDVAVATLSYDNTDEQYHSTYHSKAGKTYTLKAIASGSPDVTATATVPSIIDAPLLSVVKKSETKANGPGNSYTVNSMEVTFQLNEAPSDKDYYLIRVLVNDSITNDFIMYACMKSSDNILKQSNDFSTGDNCYGTFYLTDALINGASHSFTLSFETNSFFSGGPGGPGGPGGGPKTDAKKYYLSIAHVTKDYYNYIKSLEIYQQNAGNPFSEPTQVTSNITNGYGIFGGASYKTTLLK